MVLKKIKKDKALAAFNLAALLNPIAKEDFFQQNWEKEPLVIHRKSKDYYQQLFTIEAVDKILYYNRPTGNSVRVVKNQEPLLPSKYENPDGSLNLNQIYAAYGDGYTIVVNEIQRFSETIKQLCWNIKQEISHHVVGNMYLTPPNQKALLPHYDTHDVLVIQIHGSKEWRVFDAPYESPLLHSHQPVFQENQLTGSKSVRLEAGDFMYMPRGVPHYAFTEDESSIHLTIGVHPKQWLDLMSEALNVLALQDVDFRKALPVGYLNQEHFVATQIELFKAKFGKLMTTFQQNANPAGAIGMLQNKFNAELSIPGDGHFAQLDKRDKLTLKSQVQIRNGLTAQVIPQGNVVRIAFPGNTIKGSIHIAPALTFIAQPKGAFTVADIPVISDQNKLKLTQRLIRGGLLKIVQL